jgi:membrane-bound ClpP family serine protease
VSFAFGSVLLINAPDAPFLQISIYAIAAVTAVLLGFFLVVVAAILRSRRWRVVTGREGMLDASGLVRRAVEPGHPGIILVQGELWQATTRDGRLGVGERVIVDALDGLLLTVHRATDVIPAPARPSAPVAAKSGAARA